jgi:hypothetical protein
MAGFLPFNETDLLTLYRKVGSLLYFVIHHAVLWVPMCSASPR